MVKNASKEEKEIVGIPTLIKFNIFLYSMIFVSYALYYLFDPFTEIQRTVLFIVCLIIGGISAGFILLYMLKLHKFLLKVAKKFQRTSKTVS